LKYPILIMSQHAVLVFDPQRRCNNGLNAVPL
jgi:hypothetical protein